MDAINQRALQYLNLGTAAAVAHIQLAGTAPSAHDTLSMQRILNDVAHALSLVAPIHGLDDMGKVVPIDEAAFAAGRFEQGGALLVLPDGTTHKRLVIQRKDLDAAVSILRHTPLGGDLRSRQHA